MRISTELLQNIRYSNAVIAPYLQEVAAEQSAYETAIIDMGFLTGLPTSVIRDRFRAYVTTHPHDWRTYWTWFKAGDKEVWAALRGEDNETNNR